MNTPKKLFISAVAAFGLFTQIRAANATSIGAWFGKPTDSSTVSCWVQRTSHVPSQPDSLQNVCGGAPPSWDMPLLVQSSGHTVTIMYDGAATLSCTLFALSQNGGVSNSQTATNGSSSQGTLSMSATVPSSGSLLLRCTPSQGAGLHAINYNM